MTAIMQDHGHSITIQPIAHRGYVQWHAACHSADGCNFVTVTVTQGTCLTEARQHLTQAAQQHTTNQN